MEIGIHIAANIIISSVRAIFGRL